MHIYSSKIPEITEGVTFGDRVALLERIESRLEGVKSSKLHDLAEAVKVGDGAPNGFSILPNFVEAMGMKQSITRSRFV